MAVVAEIATKTRDGIGNHRATIGGPSFYGVPGMAFDLEAQVLWGDEAWKTAKKMLR